MEEKEGSITKKFTYEISDNSGDLTSYSKNETDRKFKEAQENLNQANIKLGEALRKIDKMDYLLIGVVIVMLIMVSAIVIDSFHINSITYKEYSQKIEQFNKNQQEIIGLKQILVNKK